MRAGESQKKRDKAKIASAEWLKGRRNKKIVITRKARKGAKTTVSCSGRKNG